MVRRMHIRPVVWLLKKDSIFTYPPAISGVSEWLFSEYYADIVPTAQIALVVSLVWRIFSYYIYLLVGLVVIPSWLKKRK